MKYVLFHPKFRKELARLDAKIEEAFYTRLDIFSANFYDSILENHPLKGRRAGQRSINITGDYRAVFEEYKNDVIVFVEIGRHKDLYE